MCYVNIYRSGECNNDDVNIGKGAVELRGR